MSDSASTAQRRLSQVKDCITSGSTATTIPFDPNCTSFPTRKEVPQIPGAPPGAAWVWGPDDNIGRLNLLTPTRVKAAAAEIRTGETICLNRISLPLHFPETPAFGREIFQHTIKTVIKNYVYDDLYSMNTQSGSQWDGFRHFAHVASGGTFYNDTHGEDIVGEQANDKCSIHHWAEHGIAGRGVLLDYRTYANKKGITYDPYDTYSISWEELYRCGKDQGVDIRPEAQGGHIRIGDILLIRTGFVEAYNSKPADERASLALRGHQGGSDPVQRWAGIAQGDTMLDWLHDCYFAAVAGDAPTFEAWPTQEGKITSTTVIG
ncbi:hypothetical protein MMC26_004640 [Xylographa opegraphella]|nr:hypothetical protein [Xylographa opegraphella]